MAHCPIRLALDLAAARISGGQRLALLRWRVDLTLWLAVLGAFACALVTGVIFGFMPARKAARLDPVTALTSE